MTKDVMLAIRGLQMDGSEDNAELEMLTTAQYYKKENSHYVMFEESHEDMGGSTKNIVKLRNHSLELTKRGLVNTHMVFEEHKKTMTNYATPFVNILLGIEAKKLYVQEEENRIRVQVDYVLEMNGEYLADCNISMDIRAK